MAFLIHLLFAHFLADYPLQPGRLVNLKMKHVLGVFIHGLIHLAVLILILSPLLHEGRTWGAILIIYISHSLIDHFKVKLDRGNPNHHKFFYFFDQLLHWSILIGVAHYLGDITPRLSGKWLEIYTNTSLVLFLLLLVLGTYFYDVTRHFVTKDVGKIPYKRDYKVMIRNALIITLGFILYWIAY